MKIKDFFMGLFILAMAIFVIMLFGGLLYMGFHSWTNEFLDLMLHYFGRLLLIGGPSIVILAGINKLFEDFQ